MAREHADESTQGVLNVVSAATDETMAMLDVAVIVGSTSMDSSVVVPDV